MSDPLHPALCNRRCPGGEDLKATKGEVIAHGWKLYGFYVGNIEKDEVVKYLRENYEICVNPCGGELGDRMFRVAHIGNTTIADIDELIEKLILSIEQIKYKQLLGV